MLFSKNHTLQIIALLTIYNFLHRHTNNSQQYNFFIYFLEKPVFQIHLRKDSLPYHFATLLQQELNF